MQVNKIGYDLAGFFDFMKVSLLSRIHHRNLVKFYGFCQEEGKDILVYEFMHNGTLKEHLYGNFLISVFSSSSNLTFQVYLS